MNLLVAAFPPILVASSDCIMVVLEAFYNQYLSRSHMTEGESSFDSASRPNKNSLALLSRQPCRQ